jgi:glycosyltransferase involved in cell wall biosynthesis
LSAFCQQEKIYFMGVSNSQQLKQLISVIIPTYNCDRYIIQAIDSVLIQENCQYEIIVIDDGSTDYTKDILEPYQKQIRYVQQTNQGVAAAFNCFFGCR